MHPNINGAARRLKGDLGYQGIQQVHPNSQIPHKKPKNGELSKKQQKQNKRFRRKRVKIEHFNRRCKCFRIVKDTFRNHLNHIEDIWLIICGMVNLKT
jgi:hypothetical protein